MEILNKKNLLRWMMMFVTAVALSVSLAACGDDDDDDEPDGGLRPLTGTWICDNMFNSGGYKYVFNSDGSGTACYTKSGARVDKFTDYMVESGGLFIKWVDDDYYEEKGRIKISGGTFQISFNGGADWYTFNRQ